MAAKIVLGQNDLQSAHPELLEEWDYQKNTITPDKISCNTPKKVFWKCYFGHSWGATVFQRTHGSRCPKCRNISSFPEQALYFYLKACFPDCIFQDRTILGRELDVFIPSIKTAIEYDGTQWHKNKAPRDLKKTLLCKEKGVRLIRIREEGLAPVLHCQNITRRAPFTDDTLDEVILELLQFLKAPVLRPVDTKSDTRKILQLYQLTFSTEKSLAAKYPELVKEWNATKNKEISLEQIHAGAKRKVWWVCPLGHEWEARVVNRVSGTGCPYCTNRKLLPGYNDLATTHPFLMPEWDFNKNMKKPSEYTAGSGAKVWWKCSLGHSFKMGIYRRTTRNYSCPYCSNQAVLVGYNDLVTLFPAIAKEWHPTKNGDATPSDFVPGSNKKAWWKCDYGHEFMMPINSRTRYSQSCPKCRLHRPKKDKENE